MPLLHVQCHEHHTQEQKRVLAKELTVIVAKSSSIPEDRVQVMFSLIKNDDLCRNGIIESDKSANLVNGTDAESAPWLLVQMQMFEGRSLNQKRELVDEMTKVVSKHFYIDLARVQIIFSEMNRINNSTGGVLVADQHNHVTMRAK